MQRLALLTRQLQRPLALAASQSSNRSLSIVQSTPPFALATSRTMSSASIPATMKAIQIKETGGLDVLRMAEDVPVPKVGNDDQVLIKLEYAGVNFIDTYQRSGLYKLPLPFVLGQEGAGVVAALGEQAKNKGLQVGDKVATYGLGSFAEYMTMPCAKIAKLPSHVDTKMGAAALLQGMTAWTLLREAYEVKRGDHVLVHAAAGGTGTLVCQMGKHLGAHVIGTASTEEKVQLAKSNGAEHVINYSKENLVDRVMEITNGKGVEGIYDGVGKDTWEDDFKMVARKGTIVTFGNASGPVEPFSPMKLAGKNTKVIRPTLVNYTTTEEEYQQHSKAVFDLMERGIVRIAVHKEYPFSVDGIRSAQEDLTGRKTTGKLVVKIA